MVRITRQTDYGIFLLTYFLDREVSGQLWSSRDLARQSHIPFPMVSKILKLLARNEILLSHRGVKGGYTLARAPEAITVVEVIDALEGPIALTECVDNGGCCQQEAVCPVRSNWAMINLAIRDVLQRISLAEMSRPIAKGQLGRSLRDAPLLLSLSTAEQS